MHDARSRIDLKLFVKPWLPYYRFTSSVGLCSYWPTFHPSKSRNSLWFSTIWWETLAKRERNAKRNRFFWQRQVSWAVRVVCRADLRQINCKIVERELANLDTLALLTSGEPQKLRPEQQRQDIPARIAPQKCWYSFFRRVCWCFCWYPLLFSHL